MPSNNCKNEKQLPKAGNWVWKITGRIGVEFGFVFLQSVLFILSKGKLLVFGIVFIFG